MAFEVAETTVAGSAGSPDTSSSEIDRLLSEILNDPSVFSLIDSSPASSSSSAPSPPCYSPSPQQLEQEALASLEQEQLQRQSLSRDQERCCVAPQTPSPGTPSSYTEDHQAFFSPSPFSHASPHHPHPTTLPIFPSTHPTSSPSPISQQVPSSLQPQSMANVLRNVEVTVNTSFSDPLLRGKRGRLLLIEENSLARVFLYSLSQECQVPVTSLEFVSPSLSDPVRVIHGPLCAVNGWLVNSMGPLSHIKLQCGGSVVQVNSIDLVKLADGVLTPVATPTSPHPLQSPTSPSFAPPLLSPASLPHPHHHSLSPHSPTGIVPAASSYPPPNSNRLAYANMPYARQARRPVVLSGPTGAIRTPTSRQQNHFLQMSEIHRRRLLLCQQQQQQREFYQCRMQQAVRNSQGNAANLARNFQVPSRRVQSVSSSSSGGRTVRMDQEYRSLVRSLDRPTQDILEEIRGQNMVEYDFGSTGDGGELSSNCIQVPLICPLSQRRMTLPCRGVQCKHPQCFDAEAYIEFNKCVLRPKEKKCQAYYKSIKQQLLKCPLCSKHLPFSNLCIDKILLEIVQDTDEDEVEFDKTGSWKPVEKKSAEDVIDLTLEEEDSNSPKPPFSS